MPARPPRNTRHPPVVRDFPHMLHGGDYNPEQWGSTPAVWDEDMRLMKVAGCNAVSLGIFAWTALEPEEGRFDFSWMDETFDRCERSGVRIILATPGGAKPAWMAYKYPETLRVDSHGRRQFWGGRHNHCFTSPKFRELAQIINTKLAERYAHRPTLSMWHVNNEYSGECHCDMCQAAFRRFLRTRYKDDLDALNHAWWSAFWSHTITNWEQINPPSPIGEQSVHGHTLDWKRFITHQTIDCFRAESAPLKRITPNIPITTNLMMGGFTDVDYYALARECDVVSWDSYPEYHDRPGAWTGANNAVWVSFINSQRRAMLDKPFVLMECSPGVQNYKPVCKLKRPGLHAVEALQAVAHGSDSVLYFQWRKSRGGVEKLHGAVVDHYPSESVRTFREVADLGRILARLDDVVGTGAQPEVAFIYDYENRWALNAAAGPRNDRRDKDYDAVVREFYIPFWSNGVPVDVISQDDNLERYKLLIAPMLYMIRPGVAERIERFVAGGGTLVTTFMTGMVNESDLVFQSGFPGPLRTICGVWAEEIDALYDDEQVKIIAAKANGAGLKGPYAAGYLCDLLHVETARVLATYGSEFYKGHPAVTVNSFGKGRAYYVASRNDAGFHSDFAGGLINQLGIRRSLGMKLPEGVTATVRSDGSREFIFVLGFNREPVTINLGQQNLIDLMTKKRVGQKVRLPKYGWLVLQREAVPPAKRPPRSRKRQPAAR